MILPFFSYAEGIDKKIDEAFAPISDFFSNVIFFTIYDIPFVLMLLVFSALFFTVYFAFPNIRYFRIAVKLSILDFFRLHYPSLLFILFRSITV